MEHSGNYWRPLDPSRLSLPSVSPSMLSCDSTELSLWPHLLFSPSTTWDLEREPRSSGLATGTTFTCDPSCQPSLLFFRTLLSLRHFVIAVKTKVMQRAKCRHLMMPSYFLEQSGLLAVHLAFRHWFNRLVPFRPFCLWQILHIHFLFHIHAVMPLQQNINPRPASSCIRWARHRV